MPSRQIEGQGNLKLSNINELKTELENAATSDEKIETLSNLAFYYRRRNYQPDSSIFYIQKLLKLCERHQDPSCYAKGYLLLGEHHTNQDSRELGLTYLKQSMDLLNDLEAVDFEKDVFYNLARNYYLSGINDTSIIFYQKVLDHNESSHNNKALAKIGIAKSLAASDLSDQAEVQFENAFKDHRDHLSKMDQYIILSEIMDFYTNNYPSPEQYAQYLPLITELEKTFFKHKGQYHIRKGFTEKIPVAKRIEFLKSSIPHLKENKYTQGLIYAYFDCAKLLHENSRSDEALNLLSEFFDFQNNHPNISPPYYVHLYDLKYKIEMELGMDRQALASLEAYKRLEDSIRNVNNIQSLQDINVKYQTAQKDIEIANQNLEISKKTSQRNYYLVGLLIVGLLSVFFLNRFQLKQRLAEEKISNLEQKQKILAMDFMVRGQENERKRIAKDLHDGLGGLLATARLQLQNIQKEIDKLSESNLFQKAENLIDNAHEEVRRIAHNMMPNALLNLGLVSAIGDLAKSIEGSKNMKVDTYFSREHLELSEEKEINLYRIIQEACQNILKHADASRILIQLIEDESNLSLTIEDNGIGFDVDKM